MGIDVQHEGFPWVRAQAMVRNGVSDAFITVPTDSRREFTVVSKEPVIVFETFVSTMKDSPHLDKLSKVKSLDGLKGYKIVDYLGNGWARNALKNLNVKWLPDYDAMLKFLEQGKADLIISSRKMIHTAKKLEYAKKMVFFDHPMTSIKFHLCVNKNSEYSGIINKFDQEIKKAKAEGLIEKIISSYY
jgi:polar amino acid transport system substrate-binding protein